VFPAEVEAALTEHPAVADVAVVGAPDDEWGRRVHAVIETVPGASVGEDELDAHCRARIAAYKVPRTYEFVDALPRNEAGKVRRSALIP
jgi:bile acid-coenzyme A ligase